MHFTLDRTKQWLQAARQVSSPNCDARPDGSDITLIVVHGISLPPAEFGGGYVEQLFTNQLDPKQHAYFAEIEHLRVSAHLFIERHGAVTQFVPLQQRAWHAGESSFCGEQGCNDFSIGIEVEGTDETAYAPEQYASLAAIIKTLQQAWPAISDGRITSHAHIAAGRKTDPGPAFDWSQLGLPSPDCCTPPG